jgi:antitoxin (DNA-binding transcriptional repressor) of toxin-antitoxin stability system
VILTLPLAEVSERLTSLVRELKPDDAIVLTEDGRSMARIVPEPTSERPRQSGGWKGKLEIVDDSDEEILEIFKDYTR